MSRLKALQSQRPDRGRLPRAPARCLFRSTSSASGVLSGSRSCHLLSSSRVHLFPSPCSWTTWPWLTPWKLANATNQSCLGSPLSNSGQHSTGHPSCPSGDQNPRHCHWTPAGGCLPTHLLPRMLTSGDTPLRYVCAFDFSPFFR